MSFFCGETNNPSHQLKIDQIANWMESWMASNLQVPATISTANDTLLEVQILEQFTDETLLAEGYRFVGKVREDDAIWPVIASGVGARTYKHVGTFRYQFQRAQEQAEVLVACAYVDESCYNTTTLACVPDHFAAVWNSFLDACNDFAYPPDSVRVIGGNHRTLKTQTRMEDIILPQTLKERIFTDVETFFTRGVQTYQEMKLNPFRKLLLAGVPGTGKTMMCNALANWALDQGYMVIYISSSSRGMGESDGANFWKIQYGLETASYSNRPALIILEELDAYLKEEEKALILNVLDGAEGEQNPHGTLLLATTNYPEKIDVRVLKRPGRLDRIYIVPPLMEAEQAEAMLRLYLRQLWREEHRTLAPQLVGYPGAFVREVVLYAITQMIESDVHELSLADLQASLDELKIQIESRDELISANQNGHQAEPVI